MGTNRKTLEDKVREIEQSATPPLADPVGPLYRDRQRTFPNGTTVHPSAYISQTAMIGARVTIEANAYVLDGAVIGDRTVIREGAVVGVGAKIGTDTVLGNGATVAKKCNVKSHTVIGIEDRVYHDDYNSTVAASNPRIVLTAA